MFGLAEHVRRLRDSRRRPQISTSAVWMSTFALFVLRFRSFNAFEQELRRPRVWEAWIGPRKPSADTLGRVLAQMDLASLRGMLLDVHRRMWRAKALRTLAGERMRVVAVDGHELWSSRARCCPKCQTRRVKTADGRVTEYYHRVVVAQWVDVSIPVILDVELVKPGEGEVVAARRLLDRLLSCYGRLIDVITGDALYLEAPFCQQMKDAGKSFIVVMKQEARDLYQDADGLRSLVAPAVLSSDATTTRLWDFEGLTSFSTFGTAVRVVWAEEEHAGNVVVAGEKELRTDEHRWAWVTNLPGTTVRATTIARWGHHRWDIENCGFNELAALWGMDHCFIHEATAIVAVLLTLAMALAVTFLFFERNLKPEARRHLTRLALAGRFREEIAAFRGISLWPAPEPDG